MAQAKRKLAAILSADVSGYSRLMGDDERATLNTLNAYRAVFREHIGKRDGRVVDTAGDSVLAVFDSVVEAVQCAVDVQTDIEPLNADLPEARRMLFRIGVNLGDVIVQDDGTIYGDGVNVAARLEGLSDPGGICLSQSAHMHVDGKIDATFADIGEHQVKNIAKPIRAYGVRWDEAAPIAAAEPALKLPDKPSIAVLAFDNLSGDEEQAYFADGISEDIITDISKVSGLFVTARNSSFAYKNKTINVARVCRELGVRYLLEGSVRKAGGRVRITAQLIDGATGGHLWGERYDRQLDDIFAVQDEVTQKIVAALKVSLTPVEQLDLVRRGTTNIEAYDAFMRGREWILTWTQAGHEKARPWLEKAVALDPNFADPVAYLASISGAAWLNRWGKDWQRGLDVANELASKAVALDDRSPHAHYSLGTQQFWSRRFDSAMAEQRRAIALDPNFALGHASIAMVLHYSGDSAAALGACETAVRLDPIGNDVALHQIGLCHFMLGDYAAAESAFRERISQSPSTNSSRVLLAATHGHQGRIDDAKAVWTELMAMYPDYSFAEKLKILPYKNQEDPKRITDGLRAAGIEI